MGIKTIEVISAPRLEPMRSTPYIRPGLGKILILKGK
jgi:hypothetical protein